MRTTILFRPTKDQKGKIGLALFRTAKLMEDLRFTDEEAFLFIAALTKHARDAVEEKERKG